LLVKRRTILGVLPLATSGSIKMKPQRAPLSEPATEEGRCVIPHLLSVAVRKGFPAATMSWHSPGLRPGG